MIATEIFFFISRACASFQPIKRMPPKMPRAQHEDANSIINICILVCRHLPPVRADGKTLLSMTKQATLQELWLSGIEHWRRFAPRRDVHAAGATRLLVLNNLKQYIPPVRIRQEGI